MVTFEEFMKTEANFNAMGFDRNNRVYFVWRTQAGGYQYFHSPMQQNRAGVQALNPDTHFVYGPCSYDEMIEFIKDVWSDG